MLGESYLQQKNKIFGTLTASIQIQRERERLQLMDKNGNKRATRESERME